MPELVLRHHDAAGMHRQQDVLLEVYTEVYADLLADPFFTPARFWQRLENYAKRQGFALITGWLDDTLVGYTLGFTLPKQATWWGGFLGDVDPALLEEDGRRTFAVTQLMVVPGWQRRGYAHRLHGALLDGRAEERATLLVKPDNVPARTAYLSWGWHLFGQVQPFDDAPVYDALMYELRAG
ncbi:GNAT family N-acetyltransferase [Amycolatopsis minnesotensis]|uniref:GNAT family N-acetyltransferase n=1 Tax=Amycolatopsis minnesotensis TaxID=337894 RepID=UPI0031E05290